MSAISGYISQIQNAVYGEQVRGAIISALEACYSDVESPSLNQAAFTAAINAAYAGGILDIVTVTQISAMTNQNIIYRYNGTEAGKQKGLYYYSALSSSWVLIGSEIHSVSLMSRMTDTNSLYKYTGTETGKQKGIYYHNGTDWEFLGGGVQSGTLDDMTNTKMLYRYTGTNPTMIPNALYYHNGTDWVPVNVDSNFGNAKNTVSVVPRWITGTFGTNGGYISSSTAASHEELVKVQKGATIQIKETEEDIVFNLALFTSTGAFLKIYKNSSDTDSVTIERDGYVRISVRYSDSSSLDAATAATIGGLIKITTPVYYGFNSINCATEYGSHDTTNGMPYPAKNYVWHRSQKIIKTGGVKHLKITMDSAIVESASFVRLICFKANKTVTKIYDNYSKEADCVYVLPDDVKYVRIAISFENDFYNLSDIVVSAENTLKEVYGFNKPSYNSGNYVAFNFPISKHGRLMSSGKLVLPPNYDPENGKPVPLVLLVPGSGGIQNWNFTLGSLYTPMMDYWAKEGFATLTVFPWSNKYELTDVWCPYSIPIINQSYIAGIEYACSRYNIDINRVVCACVSQGGAFGNWAIMQENIPIKAVAFYSTGNTIVKYNNTDQQLFLQQAARDALTKFIDFDGTNEEINAFITTGMGLESETVMNFMEKNIDKIVPIMPFAEGLRGCTAEQIFSLGTTPLDEAPQWMLDKGLPSMGSGEQVMSMFASRGDLSKKAPIPSLFFGALDDGYVSTRSNYAIYTWLLNGASDTKFRMFPNGTGDHYCAYGFGNSNVLKTNVTTALGIEVQNVPVGMVETTAFFHDKLCDL